MTFFMQTFRRIADDLQPYQSEIIFKYDIAIEK